MQRTGKVLLGAATAAATLLAWLLLDSAPAPARFWAATLLVPFPVLMVAQARMLEESGPLPRVQAYVSSIASLWALALATLGLARLAEYPPAYLGLTGVLDAGALVMTGALVASGVAVLFAFRMAGVQEPAAVRELMPQTGAERLLFVGVSVTAGICEEIMFRGFLFSILQDATNSVGLALLLSSGAFGVVHAYQKSVGALRAALLGALLTTPLLLGESLYPAILAHTLIDILSGLWLSRYLLR